MLSIQRVQWCFTLPRDARTWAFRQRGAAGGVAAGGALENSAMAASPFAVITNNLPCSFMYSAASNLGR